MPTQPKHITPPLTNEIIADLKAIMFRKFIIKNLR